MTNDCIIGELIDYDNTRLVTLGELKRHIADGIRMSEYCHENGFPDTQHVYSLADYCDGRRSTDLRRFLYCPCCGEMIPWKQIKEGTRQ